MGHCFSKLLWVAMTIVGVFFSPAVLQTGSLNDMELSKQSICTPVVDMMVAHGGKWSLISQLRVDMTFLFALLCSSHSASSECHVKTYVKFSAAGTSKGLEV